MKDTEKNQARIDHILKRFRREVDRIKKKKVTRPVTILPHINDTSHLSAGRSSAVEPDRSLVSAGIKKSWIWRSLDRFNDVLRRFGPYDRAYAALRDGVKKMRRPGYDYKTIESYQDEEFITLAYRVLLNRVPDPAGMHLYITGLRNGSLNKIDILSGIRYHSFEGREKRIRIRGLRPRYIVNKITRIPLIGYLLRYLWTLITLPRLLKKIDMLNVKTEINYTVLHRDVTLLKEEAGNRLPDIIRQLHDMKLNILDQQKRLTKFLDDIRTSMPEGLSREQLSIMKSDEDHLLDALYVSFEERFRGSRDLIKERLKVYLPYIAKSIVGTTETPVLDIGCGRGEWLELLRENGYAGLGIDRNRIMIHQCLELGLDAAESDAIEYLRNREKDSLGAVTGFHIVEHLPLNVLLSLLDECLNALKPGGMIIFETPNPENLIVGACNFYTDPTHLRPIPPATLKFLAEARGFRDVEIMRLNGGDAVHADPVINAYFFSQPDYSVIGYKA